MKPSSEQAHLYVIQPSMRRDALWGWACVLALVALSALIGLASASLLYLLGDRDKTAPAKLAQFMDHKLGMMEAHCSEVSRQESFNPNPYSASYQRRAVSFVCPTEDQEIPVEVVYWSTLTLVPPQPNPSPVTEDAP